VRPSSLVNFRDGPFGGRSSRAQATTISRGDERLARLASGMPLRAERPESVPQGIEFSDAGGQFAGDTDRSDNPLGDRAAEPQRIARLEIVEGRALVALRFLDSGEGVRIDR